MKRSALLVLALAAMMTITGLALQNSGGFPLLDWAAKAESEPIPTAFILEMGLKDENVRDWSGQAVFQGAKLLQREGYRFRDDDKLLDEGGWQASSHRGLRAPKGMPAISKVEPIASVGVVFHVSEIKDDAQVAIALKAGGDKAKVSLKDLQAGKTVSLWGGLATMRMASSAVRLAENPRASDDFPAAAYGPDGTLWVAYIRYHETEPERRIEPPKLEKQPANFKRYYTPEFREQVLIQTYRDKKWSNPVPLQAAMEDIARVAITCDAKGTAWVAYAAQRDGNFDVYARPVALGAKGGLNIGKETRVTSDKGPDIHPVMTTDNTGAPWLACQSWTDKGEATIQVFQGAGEKWQSRQRIGFAGENCWHPALAAGPQGGIAVAYDVYHNGNYDVRVSLFIPAHNKFEPLPIATSPRYEARPALVYDQSGRLWVAYEEGPEKWGKDYGALDAGDGSPLYNERSVRVACLEPDGTLKRPTAELPTSRYDPPVLPFEPIKTGKFERATRYSNPRLALDGKGRVWLTYRENFGTRYTTHPGPYWLTFARRLSGGAWSEPVELHHSDGLLDHRPALLPYVSGGLIAIHNTDGRQATPEHINNEIFASYLTLNSEAAAPDLVAHDAGKNPPTKAVTDEYEAVARMRKYRAEASGKPLMYLRGEYHRHTEISWDGAPDGSLEDMFRYAIDAARMDWIGNGDHDNGAGREYSWHLTQKWTDAFHAPGVFTPMFTYERSVAYPHGHRNVMFAQRGIRTLQRLAPPEDMAKAPGGVHPDDTKMLYRYLRELGGICAVHTSATGMGTDWRDNDPVAEPIVEIYQGDRMSYEMENAPRAGYDPKTGVEPANVAGWFPLGFINRPLQKGVKLGFQASSDHWSTHISFFIILAEANDRKSLLDAVKKRHCYGATDNILVDFRCGPAIMGDETKTNTPPTFKINVHGTNSIAKIDMLRDSEVIATLNPKGPALDTQWTDPSPQQGNHYYYIRVLQTDNEIAWGSPIWVEYKK